MNNRPQLLLNSRLIWREEAAEMQMSSYERTWAVRLQADEEK